MFTTKSGAVSSLSLEITYWLAKYPLFAPSLGIFPLSKNTRLLNSKLRNRIRL